MYAGCQTRIANTLPEEHSASTISLVTFFNIFANLIAFIQSYIYRLVDLSNE